jgi:hypothetical protein
MKMVHTPNLPLLLWIICYSYHSIQQPVKIIINTQTENYETTSSQETNQGLANNTTNTNLNLWNKMCLATDLFHAKLPPPPGCRGLDQHFLPDYCTFWKRMSAYPKTTVKLSIWPYICIYVLWVLANKQIIIIRTTTRTTRRTTK